MKQFIHPFQPTLFAIRLRQLGDVLATLGALKAIKEAKRAQKIAFMVDRHYHELLDGLDYIDMLLPQPPEISGMDGVIEFARYIDDLRKLGAHCTLDFHSNPTSALVSYLSGAPIRIGFDVRVRKWAYTHVEPRAVFRNARRLPRTSQESAFALARHIGIEAQPEAALPEFQLKESAMRAGREALLSIGVDAAALEGGGIIGINPGNPYASKAWPEAHFVGLAERLAAAGRQVVVLWGPGEREKAETIRHRCGPKIHLAPPLRLAELPGFMKHLSVLITIDSGLKHLAVSVRVPTVTIFGPTSPFEWHMGTEHDRFLFRGLSCSPCRLLRCPFGSPCMSRISSDEVVEQIEVIERIKREGQWT